MKNEITDFMELRDQFDVRLQGCSDDCKVFKKSTASEVAMLERMGVKCDEPGPEDMPAGYEVAGALGIPYCYYDRTPKNSIYH